MGELFETTLGDSEKYTLEMTKILTEAGWVEVEGVVESITVGLGIFYPVKPGAVAVFNPTSEVQRQLPEFPGMARNMRIMMPHVMLAKQTFRYGLGNSIQIAAGTIAGIMGYKLQKQTAKCGRPGRNRTFVGGFGPRPSRRAGIPLIKLQGHQGSNLNSWFWRPMSYH